jgi:hypothetical protein
MKDSRVRMEEVLLLLDRLFLFSLTWSVGAALDGPGQTAFSAHLRKECLAVHPVVGQKTVRLDRQSWIPDGGLLVHDYFVDGFKWASWADALQR